MLPHKVLTTIVSLHEHRLINAIDAISIASSIGPQTPHLIFDREQETDGQSDIGIRLEDIDLRKTLAA